MKKLILSIVALAIISPAFATESFVVMPDVGTNDGTVQAVVEQVGQRQEGRDVRDQYNDQAYNTIGRDVGRQVSSGVMTRDTLLDYAIYLAQFLSQLGLFVGAVMIIRAGYEYASAVFTGKTPKSSAVSNAIIGVIVITFSYAIIRILTRAFLS